MRAVRIEGLFNARDLGGLRRDGGGATPFGGFVRADQPDLVTDRGWRALQERGIATVIDLRQPRERDAARARIPSGIGDLHVDHDGLDAEPEFWTRFWENGLVGTPLYYGEHLRTLPGRTTAVLAAIADAPPGGVLLHCAAGRDRTGIVSAVLLAAAAVEEDEIVADYLESLATEHALAVGRGWPDRRESITTLLADRGTDVETAFRLFLAGLDLERLLAGLTDAQRRAIRTWRGAIEE